MLKLENLTKTFGGLYAVNECSLEIERGTITGLIGPNGAGKTTIFNMIAGALVPTSGRIIFEGKDIAGLPTYKMFHLGIVRTFQIPMNFPNSRFWKTSWLCPPGRMAKVCSRTGSLRRPCANASARC